MKKTHINFPIEVTEIIGFLTGMIEFQETGIDILAGEAGAVTGEAEAGIGGVEAETGGVEVETGGVEVGNVVAIIDHLAGIVRGRQKKKREIMVLSLSFHAMSLAFLFCCCYFHGFFIYMVLDFAFRDCSVMVFCFGFSRDYCYDSLMMFFSIKD